MKFSVKQEVRHYRHFALALPDAIQYAHKDCKKQTCRRHDTTRRTSHAGRIEFVFSPTQINLDRLN